MTTIKLCTDLDQSRKLAEFLPLESANMIWVLANPDLPMIRAIAYKDSDYNNKYYEILPAWSLVALLNILPSSTLDSSDDHHYRVHCKEMFTDWYDNAIDACMEMIDRLHEQMIYDFNNN